MCPRALQSLRYFKEKLPELHVIAAGSLLEFVSKDHKTLHLFFKKAPLWVSKDFKYTKIDPNIRSRELKKALSELAHAGVINQVFSTKANGIPLQAEINEKKFKLLFLDIGLLQKALQTNANTIFQDDLLQVNEGALAKQFVGQELLGYSSFIENQSLFYWSREQKSSPLRLITSPQLILILYPLK